MDVDLICFCEYPFSKSRRHGGGGAGGGQEAETFMVTSFSVS